MDEINDDFPNVDVSVLVGANPSALTDRDSSIAGMPLLECGKGDTKETLDTVLANL